MYISYEVIVFYHNSNCQLSLITLRKKVFKLGFHFDHLANCVEFPKILGFSFLIRPFLGTVHISNLVSTFCCPTEPFLHQLVLDPNACSLCFVYNNIDGSLPKRVVYMETHAVRTINKKNIALCYNAD